MKANVQSFLIVCLASFFIHFASAQTNTPLAHLAGRYVKQDFGSEYVLLGADGKYTNGLWLCSRGNYRDSGTFTLSSNLLVFTTSDPSRNPGPLRPVNWGKRLYLLHPDDISAFHAAIASKEEPRSSEFGQFLLRENDWKIPVTGSPDLPPAPNKPTENKTTAAKPARGKIIEVIDSSTAWVNLGFEHGAAVGSTLTNGKRRPTTYVFQRIYERQSIAYVRSGDAPRLGDAVSASPAANP
jgi:hypothetical protein